MRWCVAILAVLLACASKKTPPADQVKSSHTADSPHAVCPYALSGTTISPPSFVRHEIARGCAPASFFSSQPVCEPGGTCPHPCKTVSFAGPEERDTTFNYDSEGNLTRLVASFGTTTCSYARGRLMECQTSGNTRTSMVRDDRGRIVSVSSQPRAETWSFTYNVHGDLASVVEPPSSAPGSGGTWILEYDAKHRLIGETRGKPHVRYAYDSTDRVVERVVDHPPDSGYEQQRAQFKYDASGKLTEERSESGFATAFRYDARGRLVEKVVDSPVNDLPQGVRFEYCD